MEKSSKNTSSGSKGTTSSDGKAKQDGPNKYNRTSKHKENVYSRPEPARRPNPQRNRNAYDKRPRSRSGYATDRDRSEVAQIEKFEAISAIKQGSKKLSLNHLLNFTLTPPRVANEYRSGSWQGGRNVRKQKLPKYNKEQFLQANCQFVVKEEGDYSNHVEDPDKLVDWDLVEEIHLPSHQVPSCPICLYPPIAAKITRCGHIYCWACLLHYLSLSDKTWRKCPICYEAVHKNDLKSVVSTSKTTYSVGDNITMCLMKRKRGSVISKPANQFSISENPISLNDEASCFQKLLTVSRGDVEKIIKREYNELMTQLLKDKDVPEACFLESALELLQERKQSVIYSEVIEKDVFEYLTLDDKSENLSNTLNYNFQVDNHQIETMMDPFGDEEHEDNYYSQSENANKYSSTLNEEQTSSSVDENVTSDLNFSETSAIPSSSPKNNFQKQVKNQGKDYYYFYQAIDGQHIYLNALNVHMLVREYGSLEFCPHEITAKVVELEGVSMTELLRYRLRYLCHLPLTCEFQIVELQLKPLISPEVFDSFSDELNKRDLMRKRKAKEERRRERHIEREENKRLGKFPGVKYHLDSMSHFPSCSSSKNSVNLCTSDDPPLSESPSENLSAEQLIASEPSLADKKTNDTQAVKNDNQPASFAQMLREGKTKPQSVSCSPPKDQNKLETQKSTVSTPNSEEDYYEPVPVLHRQSIGDAIQAALDNLNQHNPIMENQETKKKKGRKTLLFSTSMNRRQ
uniref:E3 ubiquitin-protein ligase RNF10 n=1 Tax=Centruroides hentzi TaxID=88313 RepID=A0A2I9LPJ3_9SCOR